MRYRMETVDDRHVIRNVETDLELGAVSRMFVPDPADPNRLKFVGCRVIGSDGCEIAVLLNEKFSGSNLSPLHRAADSVATYEEGRGYPGFKAIAGPPDPLRIEFKLGELMADAASAIARAYIERGDGGIKAETKEKCAALFAQLFEIYWASSFKSFNAERGVWEPYFSNAPTSEPRMIFPDAAKHYGMFYMERQFPQIDEAALKEVLSQVLKILVDVIERLFPPVPHLPARARVRA